MTLDGLLAFFGILIGIYAIADPIQRRSLRLFVPFGWLVGALFLSLVFILTPSVAEIWWSPFSPSGMFILRVLSFAIPVVAVLVCRDLWKRARLTDRNKGRLTDVLKTSLRESRFDEVEKILKQNQDRLPKLPADALTVLFDRQMARALLRARSFLHLELLADLSFVKSLENRFDAIDAVVRELLRAETSPLRSSVLWSCGGHEWHSYTAEEKIVVQKTFLNPEWYSEASAHYPLIMSTREELWSGKLDKEYNQIGRNYEATQGISTRSHCVIFLAVKTHALALGEALKQHAERDFYVTDLYQTFLAILERSRYQPDVWESTSSNYEHPTPYAYLLREIVNDLRNLACEAVQAATHKSGITLAEQIQLACRTLEEKEGRGHSVEMHWVAAPPGRVAQQLAQSWSCCVLGIAGSDKNVSDSFKDRVIIDYMNFVLQLGYAPSEVYHNPPGHVEGLDAWRDLFVSALHERFQGANACERSALNQAADHLDIGKLYVFEGKKWLLKELSLGT